MVDSTYSFVSVLMNDEDIDISKPPPTPGKSIERNFPDIYKKYDQPKKQIELKSPEVTNHSTQHVNQKYNFSVLDKRGKKQVTIRQFPNKNRSRWMEELYSTSGSINSVRKNKDVKRVQKRKGCSLQEVDAIPSQNVGFDKKTVLVSRNKKYKVPANLFPLMDGFIDLPQTEV